jgi:hypothetical protein
MRRKTVAMNALVAGILLLHTARGAAQLTLYDAFEGGRISPQRWQNLSNLVGSLEVMRKLRGGSLPWD